MWGFDVKEGVVAGRGDFILNLALTGVVPSRQQSPHVPLTVEEVLRDLEECVPLGITAVHLHARDGKGAPTADLARYRELVGAVRRGWPELVICVSCTARSGAGLEERAAVLDLDGDARPDMASLTLSSMNFINGASMSDLETIGALAGRMQERGIRPELEIFDLGMCNVLNFLLERGVLEGPLYANLLLGNVANAQVDPAHLAALQRDLPPRTYWSVAGIGRGQLRANGLGLLFGNGVRTGLEDNLWWDEARSRLASNAELVERVVALGALLGRKPMSPSRFRALLDLPLQGGPRR